MDAKEKNELKRRLKNINDLIQKIDKQAKIYIIPNQNQIIDILIVSNSKQWNKICENLSKNLDHRNVEIHFTNQKEFEKSLQKNTTKNLLIEL